MPMVMTPTKKRPSNLGSRATLAFSKTSSGAGSIVFQHYGFDVIQYLSTVEHCPTATLCQLVGSRHRCPRRQQLTSDTHARVRSHSPYRRTRTVLKELGTLSHADEAAAMLDTVDSQSTCSMAHTYPKGILSNNLRSTLPNSKSAIGVWIMLA